MSGLSKSNTPTSVVVAIRAKITALEQERILLKAQANAASSLLMDVQRDCIEAKKQLTAAQARVKELEQSLSASTWIFEIRGV